MFLSGWAQAGSVYGMDSQSWGGIVFTIAGTKTFAIKHRCNTTLAVRSPCSVPESKPGCLSGGVEEG